MQNIFVVIIFENLVNTASVVFLHHPHPLHSPAYPYPQIVGTAIGVELGEREGIVPPKIIPSLTFEKLSDFL